MSIFQKNKKNICDRCDNEFVGDVEKVIFPVYYSPRQRVLCSKCLKDLAEWYLNDPVKIKEFEVTVIQYGDRKFIREDLVERKK